MRQNSLTELLDRETDLREPDKYIKDYFVRSLHLNEILDNLFSFVLPYDFAFSSTRNLALGSVEELSQDLNLIKKRQAFFSYLLDHKDFEGIYALSKASLNGYHYLQNNSPFHCSRGLTFDKSIYLRYRNKFFEFIADLTRLGELGKGSPLEVLSEDISSDYVTRTAEASKKIDIAAEMNNEVLSDNYYAMNNVSSGFGRHMYTIDFFFGFADGFRKLKDKGAELCFPEMKRSDFNKCYIKDGVNPLLYIGENEKKTKIPNDLAASLEKPITIITGDNAYGKTMILKTRGIIQAFAQAGLPVLAKEAELTLCDKILTNIGLTEDPIKGLSTYQKINMTSRDIFLEATPNSLLLLDEPTSGTYDTKATEQLKVYMKVAAEMGFDTWIVTHHLKALEPFEDDDRFNFYTIKNNDLYRLVEGIFKPDESMIEIDYGFNAMLKYAKRRTDMSKGQLKRLKGSPFFPDREQRLRNYYVTHKHELKK